MTKIGVGGTRFSSVPERPANVLPTPMHSPECSRMRRAYRSNDCICRVKDGSVQREESP